MKHIKIIELFAKKKKEKLTQRFIKRNVITARLLTIFTLKEIEEKMEWLKKNVHYNWGLETIKKKLEDDPKQNVKNLKRIANMKNKLSFNMLSPQSRTLAQEQASQENNL